MMPTDDSLRTGRFGRRTALGTSLVLAMSSTLFGCRAESTPPKVNVSPQGSAQPTASTTSNRQPGQLVEMLERRRDAAANPAQRAAYEHALELVRSRDFKAPLDRALPELIGVVREIVAASPDDAGWNIYLAELLYTADDFDVPNGPALRQEGKSLIANVRVRFPKEQRPYILESWVCDDARPHDAACMTALVDCLRSIPANESCRRSLQGMAAGYQAPRCDSSNIKPSLVLREVKGRGGQPEYSIQAKVLFAEVVSLPAKPDIAQDPAVEAFITAENVEGFSNLTERLSRTEGAEMGLFDGNRALFSAHPKRRLRTRRLHIDRSIADFCSNIEHRPLPADVAQMLKPAPP